MRSRIPSALILGALLLTGGVHIATAQEARPADTALVMLDPARPYRTQFRDRAGQEFAVDGIVSGITSGETPGFLLHNSQGQTLVVSVPQEELPLAIGQKVHVVARIPEAGVKVTALSITGPGLSEVVVSAQPKAAPVVTETPAPIMARVETPQAVDTETVPTEAPTVDTAESVAPVETVSTTSADTPDERGQATVETPAAKKAAPAKKTRQAKAKRTTRKTIAKKTTPAVKQVAKATTPKPGSSEFAKQLASYTAKIRQYNRSISTATAKQIAYAVLVKSPRYQLDPRLVFALIAQESRFNPRAISPVGAQGLGQLMPGTAVQMGVKNAFDINENVEGTVRYLARQLQQFNGNVTYALAAYNAGPGNVMRYGGVPPFSETRNYVRLINTHYNKLNVHSL